MGLVGARDRELAAGALRRHYVGGRLSLDELERRVQLTVGARTRSDLRAASSGLPSRWLDLDEISRVGRLARRGAVLAAVGAMWLVLSFLLLIGFAASALVDGVSAGTTLAFPLVWLAVTLLAWRAGRRA